MEQDSIWLGKLTRREFRQKVESGDLQLCILPTAAVEQHLEHLAMEHDWRSANLVAGLVAERLRPRVVVAQGLMAGSSEHHMRHPGTLSLRPGTFLNVLFDLVDSVRRAGIQNILVLNGHGGNVAPVQGAWDQLLRQVGGNVRFLSYWDVLDQQDAAEVLRSGHRLPDDLPGHAQEFETAIALAEFPENVRSSAISDQTDTTPSLATAEAGKNLLERVVQRVTAQARDMMDGKWTAEQPGFHP